MNVFKRRSSKKNMTISALVVDDEENIVKMFTELLKDVYKINVVGSAKNGKDAVDQFKKLRPDITFLDVMMPEFDGYYALKEIRLIDESALVVLITGDVIEDVKKVPGPKPSAIINKPYNVPTLMNVLKNELKLDINPN